MDKADGPAGGRLAAGKEMALQVAQCHPFLLASLTEKLDSPINTCLDAFIQGEYLRSQLFQVLAWYHQSIGIMCRGWVFRVTSAYSFLEY